MATEALSLFPSPVSSIPPKSCLRHAEEAHARRNTPSPTLSSKPYPSGGLRGLALQLRPQPSKPLYAGSPDAPRPSLSFSPESSRSSDGSVLSSSSPSSETTSKQKKRPAVAIRKISIETTSSDTRSDLSGLTLVRSNSGSSANPKAVPPPMQSIFPEYDPNLPLSQQCYYPKEDLRRPGLQRHEDYHQALANVPSPTSPVPAAGLSQLQALWNAASGQNASFHSDKIKLTMHRDKIGSGSTATEVRFGSREGRTLYSVSAAEDSHELSVRRHHPARTGIVPVAQIELAGAQNEQKTDTMIFPQQAALGALEAAAQTHRANSIAQYDPRASSPQAAQLAFDAVTEAKTQESCHLVRLSLGCNSYGVEEHKYELRHPRAGTFEVFVEGAINMSNKDKTVPSNGRITLHHPYSSPYKTLTKAPTLLSFDMATETLDVDIASFRKLESRYMIDSAMCAVLAVAFTESKVWARKRAQEAFDAPPLTATKQGGKSTNKRKSSRWRQMVNKKDKKGQATGEEGEKQGEKLPGLTRGILYMLGFSFEAVVWLLGLGVRVLSKVIVCVSGVVSKK